MTRASREGFTSPPRISAADRLNSPDGMADIITGAGAGGGPHVRVFNGATTGTTGGIPVPSDVLEQFFAYNPNFTGGVRVATGDVAHRHQRQNLAGPRAGNHHRTRVWAAART